MEFYLSKNVSGLGLGGEVQRLMPMQFDLPSLQPTEMVLWRAVTSVTDQ